MRTYATEAEYRTYLGDDSASAPQRRLEDASLEVGQACVSFYDTDAQGYPTEVAVQDALRDATCALLAWWDETGDVSGSGASRQFQSASIGSASYTRSDATSPGVGGRSALPSRVAMILDQAGLRVWSVYVVG